MLKMALVAGAFVALSTPVFAQDVAAVDPNVTLAQIGGVVSQCEIVAADPEIADSGNGICITATRNFLARSVPGQEAPIQDLVVRLLELAQLFPECDPFDDEIGTAIREAAGRLPENSELRPDFLAAAQTIASCDVTNLGAIGPTDASATTLG
jgi:hypothetical protein